MLALVPVAAAASSALAAAFAAIDSGESPRSAFWPRLRMPPGRQRKKRRRRRWKEQQQQMKQKARLEEVRQQGLPL